MNDLENAQEVLKIFAEAFREVLDALWENMKVIYEAIREALEVSKAEKTTFKPILRLFPFKKWLRDKRLTVNYCRNNC